jgi:alpha-L-fucosidase 2
MKRIAILIATWLSCIACSQAQEHKLWYTKPADESRRSESVNKATTGRKLSREALPLGNGRLGCMPYGGVANEFVEFNEDSLWIGDEKHTGAYQAFGAIEVIFDLPMPDVQDYRRELDLATAIHTVTFGADGIRYRREYFASHPADVLVFRFTADRQGAYNATIRMEDAHQASITAEGNRLTSKGDLGGYVYKGDRPDIDRYDLTLDYEAGIQVLHQGGTLRADGDQLILEKADNFTILLAAGTDFLLDRKLGWKGEHPHRRIDEQLKLAAKKTYQELRQEHVADYRELFDRCDLELGSSPAELGTLPTDNRNERFKTDGIRDPDFQELLFRYARYLMISCSRPGGMPANLQGLWNVVNNPNWHGDYHTDVNIQMNYWFVDAANLPECFVPFSDWLHEVREARRAVAQQEMPGVRGWYVHGSMGLVGGAAWHMIPGCGSWMAQNIWDHYAFTRDPTYLRERALPIIQDMCHYWEDVLIEESNGTLVAPPSKSPESGPIVPGTSFCQQLAWDVFTNFIEGSQDLGVDQEYRCEVADMKRRLLKPIVGSWGQLQEWREDIDRRSFGRKPNRHISHTVGIYPGRQISPLTTPDLAEAARVSMRVRGNGHTTWSRVQRSLVWARLLEGQLAFDHLSQSFERFLPNLLSHIEAPCFQIDANFGYAAAVCEMLLQSHLGEIHLLPCLPEAWPDGSVRGMKARGDFTVDMEWKQSELTKAVICSEAGTPCTLRTAVSVTLMHKGQTLPVEKQNDGTITFPTRIGETYTILPQ